MNNNFATALLAVGNTLAFSEIFLIRTCLILDSFNHFILWTILEIIAVAVLGFASQKITLWLHDKYGFNHKRYMWAACFPPLGATSVYFIVFVILGECGFFYEFGLGGVILFLFPIIDYFVSIIYLVVGIVWANRRLK